MLTGTYFWLFTSLEFQIVSNASVFAPESKPAQMCRLLPTAPKQQENRVLIYPSLVSSQSSVVL